MKYLRILSAYAAEPLAIQPEKLAAITEFLLFKADGGSFTDEELAARTSGRRSDAPASTAPGVAIIPVHGVLANRMDMMTEISGGSSYQGIKAALHEALASDDVKAVVLDIDSPGGTVPGTEELAREIMALRGGEKPIIAQVNSLAASAANWIASACDEIVVTPSGRAGSIGVYTSHDDVSGFLKQKGVTRTYLSAGKYKVEGNETEPLGEEARNHILDLVNQTYRKFLSAVADGRATTVTRVEEGFGQGRIFGAEALIERGMADRIATMEQTLERLGASTEPAVIRQIKAANAANAEAATALCAKLRGGEPITKREFEHGLKGLVGLSNSEAERAARLYLKDGQGDPDKAEKTALEAALVKALARVRA